MNTSAISITPFIQKLLLTLGLFVLSLLVFWPGVSGGFLFDDYHNIVTNAHVQIKELTGESLWRAANAYSGKTRQLSMLTFALNAYLRSQCLLGRTGALGLQSDWFGDACC